MFDENKSLTVLSAKPGEVLSIHHSVNDNLVAMPGRGMEETRAYIITLSQVPDTCSIFIYMHLLDSNVPVVYTHHRQYAPVSEYQDVLQEALDFLESMGFMMEDLDYREINSDEKLTLLKTLPPFLKTFPPFSAARKRPKRKRIWS